MQDHIKVVLTAVVLTLAPTSSVAHTEDTKTEAMPSSKASATPSRSKASLPCEAFTNPPEKPHDPADHFFAFDQLEHYYRVPGEFTYRLTGDEYGFETLSFINVGTEPFNLVAVFASKHPGTKRIGPNPLVLLWQSREGPPPCRTPQ